MEALSNLLNEGNTQKETVDFVLKKLRSNEIYFTDYQVIIAFLNQFSRNSLNVEERNRFLKQYEKFIAKCNFDLDDEGEKNEVLAAFLNILPSSLTDIFPRTSLRELLVKTICLASSNFKHPLYRNNNISLVGDPVSSSVTDVIKMLARKNNYFSDAQKLVTFLNQFKNNAFLYERNRFLKFAFKFIDKCDKSIENQEDREAVLSAFLDILPTEFGYILHESNLNDLLVKSTCLATVAFHHNLYDANQIVVEENNVVEEEIDHVAAFKLIINKIVKVHNPSEAVAIAKLPVETPQQREDRIKSELKKTIKGKGYIEFRRKLDEDDIQSLIDCLSFLHDKYNLEEIKTFLTGLYNNFIFTLYSDENKEFLMNSPLRLNLAYSFFNLVTKIPHENEVNFARTYHLLILNTLFFFNLQKDEIKFENIKSIDRDFFNRNLDRLESIFESYFNWFSNYNVNFNKAILSELPINANLNPIIFKKPIVLKTINPKDGVLTESQADYNRLLEEYSKNSPYSFGGGFVLCTLINKSKNEIYVTNNNYEFKLDQITNSWLFFA